jgi:hypothetical protein
MGSDRWEVLNLVKPTHTIRENGDRTMQAWVDLICGEQNQVYCHQPGQLFTPVSPCIDCLLGKRAPQPPPALCTLNDKGHGVNMWIQVGHTQAVSHCDARVIGNCLHEP